MRTLKAINERYEGTGYSVARNANYQVEVSFEGTVVWTFNKTAKVPEVAQGMADMEWLAWLGEKSVELAEVDTELLLTDADTISPFEEVAEEEVRPEQPVLFSIHDALELGFCFQRNDSWDVVKVFRPDGTSFKATSIEQALEWISDGEHLHFYTTMGDAPSCLLPSVMSGNLPTPEDYWSEAGVLTKDCQRQLLIANGFDPAGLYIDQYGHVCPAETQEPIAYIEKYRW